MFFLELFQAVRKLDPIDLARVSKPLHVLPQAEDGRTALGGIAARALKERRAVADHVRGNVQYRIIPGNEFTVVPNLLRLRERHLGTSLDEMHLRLRGPSYLGSQTRTVASIADGYSRSGS